jgi:hypothetical protein
MLHEKDDGGAALTPHRKIGRLFRLLLGGILFLGLSACATVPKVASTSGSSLSALFPSDELVYASVKVSRNRQLVTEVIGRSGLASSIPSSIFDRTKVLYVAVRYSADNKPVFSMVAEGDYPIGLMAWKLNWNRTWRNNKAPFRWWQDTRTGAQIAMPTRNLVLFSTGDLPVMLRNYLGRRMDPLNPTVRRVFELSDLAIYFPTLNGNVPVLGMDVKRFPIDSFYFAVTSDVSKTGANKSVAATTSEASRGGYYGYAVFRMKSDRDARLFSVVFRLLIASSATGGAIGEFPIPLKGAQLAIEGSTIRLVGIWASTKNLADLLALVISGKPPAGVQ